jgi:hypothetical protein
VAVGRGHAAQSVRVRPPGACSDLYREFEQMLIVKAECVVRLTTCRRRIGRGDAAALPTMRAHPGRDVAPAADAGQVPHAPRSRDTRDVEADRRARDAASDHASSPNAATRAGEIRRRSICSPASSLRQQPRRVRHRPFRPSGVRLWRTSPLLEFVRVPARRRDFVGDVSPGVLREFDNRPTRVRLPPRAVPHDSLLLLRNVADAAPRSCSKVQARARYRGGA